MDRRSLLKQLALLGAGATLPFVTSLSKNHSLSDRTARPFHRFAMGDLELTVITDGHIEMAPVHPHFPNGPEAAEKALLKQHFRSTSLVDLGMNILIVRKGEELIVIDTGTGNSFGPGSGWMLQSMKDAAIDPAKITKVIISHGHPDHVGGLLTPDKQPAFPNAAIYISKTEYDYWMGPVQDLSRSKFPDKNLLKKFAADTKEILTQLKDRLHLFSNNESIAGCIRMELAPGHTPGHSLTHVFSGSEKLVHLADLLHSDLISFAHPDWGFSGDIDIDQAAVTRKRILSVLTKEQNRMFGFHLPWPGIGHVRKKENGYEWIPEVTAYPLG